MTNAPSHGHRSAAPGSRLHVDDIAVGSTRRLGTHAVTQAEIIEFAGRWDPQSFHVDPTQQDHPRFSGVIASGIHSLAIVQRLTVEALYSQWRVVAGRRIGEVKFLRPVLPGTVVTGTAVVTAIDLSRAEMGLVTTECTLAEVDGPDLLRARVETYVARLVADSDH